MPFTKPKTGQIVGATYRQEGVVIKNRYDEQGGGLAITKTALVWLITDGYLNKPYEVFERDISFSVSSSSLVLPWKRSNHYWTKATRAYLSKESKDWPRDKKGRFC